MRFNFKATSGKRKTNTNSTQYDKHVFFFWDRVSAEPLEQGKWEFNREHNDNTERGKKIRMAGKRRRRQNNK